MHNIFRVGVNLCTSVADLPSHFYFSFAAHGRLTRQNKLSAAQGAWVLLYFHRSYHDRAFPITSQSNYGQGISGRGLWRRSRRIRWASSSAIWKKSVNHPTQVHQSKLTPGNTMTSTDPRKGPVTDYTSSMVQWMRHRQPRYKGGGRMEMERPSPSYIVDVCRSTAIQASANPNTF